MAKTKCPRKGTLFSTTWNTPVITTGDCTKGKVEVGTVGSGVVSLKRKDLVQVRGKAKEAVRQALASSGDHLVEWLVRTVKPSTAAAKALVKAEVKAAKAEAKAQAKAERASMPRTKRVKVAVPKAGSPQYRQYVTAGSAEVLPPWVAKGYIRGDGPPVRRAHAPLPDAWAYMNAGEAPTRSGLSRQDMDDLYNR